MLTKVLAATAVAIAVFTIIAGYTQRSALVLGEEKQRNYWSRRGTSLSGTYNENTTGTSGGVIWVPLPNRSSYGSFRGGGPSAGK
ncbi:MULTISPECIES: hypothetical protein [unclassified Coleofasciculus]|uniref:hypothetical protein n=1 Tax=unclassified Coleofasciculus TaxID=2692782 RepID=UPI00187E8D0E|nr:MULTISPECIES: hypothetical protein [unclassified Coleofasciculus]MBE9126010.1 hypothetical protein [Coleofasciculus sp. LEGE 07081]MBE9149385.1 hypothetical protein [Coleofasciculus sp. LEGE 07092]